MRHSYQIGKALRDARECATMTQQQASRQSGVSVSQIYRVERGAAANLEQVRALAAVYDVRPIDVLFDQKDIMGALAGAITEDTAAWLRAVVRELDRKD